MKGPKRLLISTILFWSAFTSLVYAQKSNVSLNVQKINTSLKENAHAVVRYDTVSLVINDLEKVIYKRKQAITAIDKNGRKYIQDAIDYNNQVGVNMLSFTVLDAAGEIIKIFKGDKIIDVVGSLSGREQDDSRHKRVNIDYEQYPYTVVVEMELSFRSLFQLPEWQPQPGPDCAVENSVFILRSKKSIQIRYKEYYQSQSVSFMGSDADYQEQKWIAKDMLAEEVEEYSDQRNNMFRVVVEPSDFVFYGKRGKMSPWSDLGDFIYQLNQGRDQLPPHIGTKAKEIVRNSKTFYDTVSNLYSFMQENTRYVALEYGLSGWQTYAASDVCSSGYGDCKGLTNYMKALLKEVGIVSHGVYISAGTDDYFKLDPDFSGNYFNHVILCVPHGNDSIWLECTSQDAPAGFLGSFTDSRKALIALDNGSSSIVQTPSYLKGVNYIHRNWTVDFQPDKSMQQVHMHSVCSGLLQEKFWYLYKNLAKEEQEKMLNRRFAFPSYAVFAFSHYLKGGAIPVVEEDIEMEVSGLTSKSPKRTIVKLGWISPYVARIQQAGTRKHNIVLDNDMAISDTILLKVPEGAIIEAMPKPKELKSSFGSFKSEVSNREGDVVIIMNYVQNEGVYPSSTFESYQQFYAELTQYLAGITIVLQNQIE